MIKIIYAWTINNRFQIYMNMIMITLYICISMLFKDINIGIIPLRLSDILCIVPFFFSYMTVGVVIGCLISNIVIGYSEIECLSYAIAIFICCIFICTIRRSYIRFWLAFILVCVVPAIVSAIVVGIAISIVECNYDLVVFGLIFSSFARYIFCEQIIVMMLAGLPFITLFPRTCVYRAILNY